MSGPKYSTAYIRELQRLQQLAKELDEQIEQTKRQQILEDISRLEKEKGNLFKNDFLQEYERIIPQAEKLLKGTTILNQFKKILGDVLILRDRDCKKEGNSDALSRYYQTYQKDILRLKNLVLQLKALKKQLSAEGTKIRQQKKAEEFLSMEWMDSGEKINIIPTDLQNLYYDILELMSVLPDYEENKRIIDKTIMESGDTDYQKRQLKLRKQAILVEQNSSQDNIKLLDLQYELRSLYQLLGYDAKEIPVDPAEAKEAISLAREELDQKQKTEYIAECIHKVFEEKGYSLIEDSIVTNKNGSVEKDYYTFGEDSLVNVSMSDQGQILFEVVGNSDGGTVDASFASKLETEMRRFCPDYAEIRKILFEKYGIALENEHLCEPDQKYARAVDMTKKDTRRKRKTEKKMMHYDDRS